MFIKITNKNKREERINICKGCEDFTKLQFCKSCGCYMPVKVYLETATCPKEKWKNMFNSWS